MKNIALKLSFVGTNYHGWQIQKTEKTIAGTLEATLSELCKHEVKLVGCGRTDAGVHAKKYCANFKTTSTIPLDKLPLAVNALLPPDIVVEKAAEAPDDFNAILSCIKKQYTYRLYNSRIRNPFEADRAYFYPQKIDIEKMKKAAKHFVGTHDFAAVRSVGTETKTTIRTMFEYEVDAKASEPIIEFKATADGFLYNMARAIVGTLIYVSEGKIDPDQLPELLRKKDRRLTGPTVPPDGLYMTKLWYGGEIGKMFD